MAKRRPYAKAATGASFTPNGYNKFFTQEPSTMIHSMTAFARYEQVENFGTLTWEIRSVNHRYLEPSFKIPDFAKACEHVLRDKLRKALSRGKIECSLRFEKAEMAADQVAVNEPLLKSLLAANDKIAAKLNNPAAEQASRFLAWPGILETATIDKAAMQHAITESFDAAVKQLIEHRIREGNELEKIIQLRLDGIKEVTDFVKPLIPQAIDKQRQKLITRFEELKLDANQERIEQELVVLAQKIDVDEELDRLLAHLKEVSTTLKKGSPCGRRLDFLMQELNREANTLGSKSILSETSQASVDLKVYIEQMREQIQNIE